MANGSRSKPFRFGRDRTRCHRGLPLKLRPRVDDGPPPAPASGEFPVFRLVRDGVESPVDVSHEPGRARLRLAGRAIALSFSVIRQRPSAIEIFSGNGKLEILDFTPLPNAILFDEFDSPAPTEPPDLTRQWVRRRVSNFADIM
jgi:hypothetical protein